jgi:uncharacterized membrane protein (UPF0127 family)
VATKNVPLRRAGGEIVCERVVLADSAPVRMKGLLGRKSLPSGEGILLRPAGSIHTAFMRFPIDAVFLDSEGTVVGITTDLKPWRAAAARGAKAVLELPAGEAERRGLRLGDRLEEAAQSTDETRESR